MAREAARRQKGMYIHIVVWHVEKKVNNFVVQLLQHRYLLRAKRNSRRSCSHPVHFVASSCSKNHAETRITAPVLASGLGTSLAEHFSSIYFKMKSAIPCAAFPVVVRRTCANKLSGQCKSWEISCGDLFGWIG